MKIFVNESQKMRMNLQQIKDIEDYCRDIPKNHVFKKDFVPTEKKPILENMVKDMLKHIIDNNIENTDNMQKKFRPIYKKYKLMPKKAQLNSVYNSLIENNKLTFNNTLKTFLSSHKCREISGVSVVAVFLSAYPNGKSFSCEFDCHYCPKEENMPRSYLHNEPGVLRSVENDFDCVRQIHARLNQYKSNGTSTDKLEVIVLGGTIHSYPEDYLEQYMLDIYYGANTFYENKDRPKYTLAEEQKINENSPCKIIGLTVETRPDCVNKSEIKKFRRWGVTRVQIGVQHTDDEILRQVNRRCYLKHTIRAVKLLRESCYKFDIHLMPNLPGASKEKDIEMIDYVFKHIKPDQIKLYPCETIPFTQILEDYKTGKYIPYDNDSLEEVVLYYMINTPIYVRNNRIIRDIPTEYIIAGVKSPNQRQEFDRLLKEKGKECRDIRTREAGRHTEYNALNAELFVLEYSNSNGLEYFISFESSDRKCLFGFIRLRLSEEAGMILPALKDHAMVRELHVYSNTVSTISQKTDKINNNPVQHMGLGRKLLKKAEEISITHDYKKIAVIAGIGTMNYYRKFGYEKKDTFMVKKFKKPLIESREDTFDFIVVMALILPIFMYIFTFL